MTTTTETKTTRFQPGRTYMMRSPCDYGCIWTVTVASRTDKTLTTVDGKRLGIRIHDGVEHVFPQGRYSMAPRLRADRLATEAR